MRISTNYLTVSQNIDYAFEETIIKYPDFKEDFTDYFMKNGFNSNLITRDNGAREFVKDITNEDILIQIIKHANHARIRMFDERIDRAFFEKYPFLKMNELVPLDYAMQGEEYLKKIVDFFIKTRYSMTVYNKNCIEDLSILLQCQSLDNEVEAFFKERKQNKTR